MITLKEVALRQGTKLLFSGATFTVDRASNAAIVGRNGSGKSSLMAALQGKLGIDAGELELPPRLEIASLEQEPPQSDQPAIEYVIDGDARLREIQAALERASQHTTDRGARHIGELYAELDAIDGYTAEARAAKLLIGLGFQSDALTRPIREFSGGWRMRLNLAKTLMCRSDLLLLDEPTNHLDFESVVWLERWLRAYPGTLLLISHDREFLDNVVDNVIHISGELATMYRGNYSTFERTLAERVANQNAEEAKRNREVAHIQQFVDRFRAKASKARQAQSRLKALERIETVSAIHRDPTYRVEFLDPGRCPDPLLDLQRVDIGYDEEPVLRNVRLAIAPGMRLGLLGRNGAGKSTLIKTLAGTLPPSGGIRTENPGLRTGYFAQDELDYLDTRASPLVLHRRQDPTQSEQKLRNFLGGFAFGGAMADARIDNFSGGEKARLVLSLLVATKPNLLLLDEPTNHLDLEMRQALSFALQDFPGAVVIVSHDRHLLRITATELLLIENGRAEPYPGDVDDYRAASLRDDPAGTSAPSGAESQKSDNSEADPRDRKTARREQAQARQERQPLTSRLKRLEKLMSDLQSQQRTFDETLADADLYADERKDELKACLHNRAKAAAQLGALEEEWLEVQEALEAIR